MKCQELQGVGPKLAEKLAKLGVHHVADLLLHLPIRFEDHTRITALAQATVGDCIVIEGKVVTAEIKTVRRKVFALQLDDGTRVMTLNFFHFHPQQTRRYQVGSQLRCFGELRLGLQGLAMNHPECVVIDPENPPALARHLTAVYPTTTGISQGQWRRWQQQALQLFAAGNVLTELLPAALLAEFDLCALTATFSRLHQPLPGQLNDTAALKRLAVEELLSHHLALRQMRRQVTDEQAPMLPISQDLVPRLRRQLPFTLTDAQERVIGEIEQDLTQQKPMLRLVQGDVGCGKTMVALMAMLQASEHKHQSVLMAPTELLAEQHYQNFRQQLAEFPVRIAWLASSIPAKEKRETLAAISAGEVDMVIGTHAVFQKKVEFANLGLMIVDEQHRFGVEQRLSLRKKGARCPHQLVMSATPIPRTLSMVFYADLDCSIIDELPKGRTPVKTVAMGEQRRDEVIERVRLACAEKAQVYWVCPLIEESEFLDCQAAEQLAVELTEALGDYTVTVIHGRLKACDKEAIMSAFKAGEVDVLVATTVIEVGVDVPNANLMIIENSERLGLSQLHQLRGRVGRGKRTSFCVLMFKSPLSYYATQRINTLRETGDGFVVAERDLQLRGPGEVLGKRQTGLAKFRVVDLEQHQYLIPIAQQLARRIEQQYPDVIALLIARWLGHNQFFAHV